MSEGNNLGFAIPIDVAKEVLKDLLERKKVERSYIGVQLQPLEDLEKFYDIANGKGVLVASVEQDSPGSVAGLKAEDILLAVEGRPVNVRFPEQLAAVRKLISDYPIGATIHLTVQRPGATEPLSVSVKTEKLESVITEEKSVAAWGVERARSDAGLFARCPIAAHAGSAGDRHTARFAGADGGYSVGGHYFEGG